MLPPHSTTRLYFVWSLYRRVVVYIILRQPPEMSRDISHRSVTTFGRERRCSPSRRRLARSLPPKDPLAHEESLPKSRYRRLPPDDDSLARSRRSLPKPRSHRSPPRSLARIARPREGSLASLAPDDDDGARLVLARARSARARARRTPPSRLGEQQRDGRLERGDRVAVQVEAVLERVEVVDQQARRAAARRQAREELRVPAAGRSIILSSQIISYMDPRRAAPTAGCVCACV